MFYYVSIAVSSAMSLGIGWTLVRPLAVKKPVKIALYGALGVVWLMSITYMPLRRNGFFGSFLEDIFASSIMAIFSLFIAAVIGDWIVRAFKRPAVTKAVRITIAIAVPIYLLYGFVSAQSAPLIKRVTVQSAKIAAPVTIAHLTDLHLGNGKLLEESFAARIADQTSALNADIVVITGDLVDAPLERVRASLDIIARIKSRYGIFFVAGNHEYFNDLVPTLNYLESIGIKVLRNSSERVEGEFGTIDIAGVYDLSARRYNVLMPDPQKALSETDDDNFIVALAHQPKMAFEFPEKSFDLMMTGHTHGGQIFPFTIAVRFAQPYISGMYDHDERAKIFISNGVGYWGPPFRVLAPNQIGLITLQSRN
ncbi:MAG: metallophosphoesterase [Helicobacteraceae bacterium]|jgi:predicted MPP superfamily phosphohydrolase|nr:metallophosphoesterase [Helicobacteraceae bacterium]